MPGEVERGAAGTTDVVLREGGGSWLTLPRSVGRAATTGLLAGLVGLVLAVPTAAAVLLSGRGWAAMWVVALWMESAAVAVGFTGGLASACFRVHRITFSPSSDDGPLMTRVVRGLRAGPWKVGEGPIRLRLEQVIEEPCGDDPNPATTVVSLRVIRDDSDIGRAVLPPGTDVPRLGAAWEEALGSSVVIELHVRRKTRPRVTRRADRGGFTGISGAGGYSCGGGSGGG
ncbi:hypothetical protein ABT084_36025 [Streptomyces sp. NPDC002138]|uniref:hypothetical protein n=1 Tax=Streptomyces sp. NPDC002138 TaxID=3154410 RepID=UPI0033330A61